MLTARIYADYTSRVIVRSRTAILYPPALQVAGSPVYTFSIYAAALGSSLGLDHVQLEGLGSMLAFGNFLALLSGSCYELMERHNRMGPRITIWVGVVLGAVGYGGLYLAASGVLQLSYLGLLGFAFVAGNASSWYDTATIVTNVRNFPNNRGAVVGLLKSFVGLSGSIYSSVYTSALSPDAPSYLLLLAVAVPLLPLLLSAGVNHVPYVEAAELHSLTSWFNPETRFLLAYVTVAALALYQMTSALLEGLGGVPSTGAAGLDLLDLNSAGMFGLLAVVLLVPWDSGGLRSIYVHDHLADPEEKAGTIPHYVHDHLADPEEKADTIPQWIKQLTHTRQLPSATIRARLDSIQAALAPPPSNSSSPAAAAAAAATASSPSRRGAAGSSPRPVGGMRGHCCGVDVAGSPMRAVQSAAVMSPAGRGSVEIMLPADEAAAAAADSSTTLTEPLLQQQQQHQQHRAEAGSQLGKVPSMARRVSLPDAAAAPGSPRSPSPAIDCRHRFTNLSLSQAVQTGQFWLLFFLFLAGVGACLTFLNNLGQIVVALGGAPGDQVVFVSIFAVGNAAGRLLMGMLPEHYLHTAGTPRTHWLLATFAALSASTLAAAAAAHPGHLYLLSLALGLCYGGIFSLIPAIAADVFGLRHFAATYSGLQTACAIGCYVFPTQLAGYFYSQAVAAHGVGEPCIGTDCYAATFVAEGVLCLLGCCAAAAVVGSTRGVYSQLAAHLSEVQQEEAQDMVQQWAAGHPLFTATRAPSDPTISATTGVPAGQYGRSVHRSLGHSNAAVAQLHSSSMARQQQQQQQPGTPGIPSGRALAVAAQGLL
ncbi:hypothetical protein OEZ86_009978 [Tetradesmus obliquus]|nr:hypothetical protein OEZ86_009978 [Tetradesmus obliquus]